MILKVLEHVPFNLLKLVIRRLRCQFATRPWPENVPSFECRIPPGTAEQMLRSDGWEGAEKYSLKYNGEVLNMRKPIIHKGLPGESHIRAKETDAGWLYNLHDEYSRFEEISRHVASENLEWRDDVSEVLS